MDLLKVGTDLYLKLSERHQLVKQVASVFKQFMKLQKGGKLDFNKRKDYSEYLDERIKDILNFE